MRTRYIIYFIALATIAACAGFQDDRQEAIDGERIAVCAGIGDPSVVTRVLTYYGYTTPSDDHPLEAEVWFTDDENGTTQFANTGSSTTLPRYSDVTFVSGGMTFPDSDVLPYTAGKATYAVGFWPKTSWTPVSSNTQATHAITGQEDLMFAPKITAAADAHFSPLAPLNFGHLLTWLKIRVAASGSEAIAAWGKITSITIASKTSLTVSLNGDIGDVTYNTDGDIVAFSNPSGTALTTSANELASVFCAPTESAQYIITIKSENETGGKAVTVNLVDLDKDPIASSIAATQGKEFIITLTFQPFNMIDAVGKSLADWTNENIPISGPVS